MSSVLRKITSFAAHSTAFEQFVSRLEQGDDSRTGYLRVLTYHRVDEPQARPWLDPVLVSATPASFKVQMEYIAGNYNVVSMIDLLFSIKSGNMDRIPPRAVLVTFDDAYVDFKEHAWPILKRLGIPATLFVPTGYPDCPERTFWWDDLHNAIKHTSRQDHLHLSFGAVSLAPGERSKTHARLKGFLKTLNHYEALSQVTHLCERLNVAPGANTILNWDSIRILEREGVILGAHTKTHPLMNRITLEEARAEVTESLRDLKRETGSTYPIFAYPGGKFNEEVVDMLRNEKVALAFTTARGMNDLRRTNPLLVKRINVGGGTSLPILRAQLLTRSVHLNWLQDLIKM